MNTFLKSVSFASAIALAPVAALAVTTDISIGAPGSTTVSQNLAGGANGTATFNYTFTNAARVVEFLLSAQGTNAGADSNAVTYSFDGGPESNFDVFNNGATTGLASKYVNGGFTFAKGDTLSIDFFGNNNQNDVSVQSSFTTTAVAAVPVPAAGLMLLSALGAAGAVARRRNKANA